MSLGHPALPASVLAVALCLCPVLAAAQGKPPESASKVRKVLLYNKVGGWVAVDGIAAVKATFSELSAAKGFDLVQQENDSNLTLDYLEQFQVIVWNNNTDGAASVPSLSARKAILDYLDQGGGWMLIHNAGDHHMSWPGLSEALGTAFTRAGIKGRAEVVLDSAGRSHPELQWMLEGFPDVFELEDRWLNFANTVRPLPGVTVVATTRAVAGAANVVLPAHDGSGDPVYLWARKVGQGRLFYNAIGFGSYKLMEQQDSIVPRLYWENLRYAAGDYLNGCTHPGRPGFDPRARVHVEALCSAAGIGEAPARVPAYLAVSLGATRMRLASPGGPLRVRLRDLRGSLVWEGSLPAGTLELALGGEPRSGIYQLELLGDGRVFRHLLPFP